jgi:hypothetical protein
MSILSIYNYLLQFFNNEDWHNVDHLNDAYLVWSAYPAGQGGGANTFSQLQ